MNTRARAKQARWKPGQSFHAKTRRPFKGATPPNVFQTTDVGFGHGHFLSHRTQGPKLRNGKNRTYLGIDYHIMDPARHAVLERARNLELRIRPAEQAIKEMIARGEKTRHINIDMPNPIKMRDTIETILRLAPKALFPNSKIFIASEDIGLIENAIRAAEKYGYRVRNMPTLQQITTKKGIIYPRRTTYFMREYMRITGNPIYRIAITYTPKQERKNKNSQ